MARKQQQHISHLPHRKPRPFNLASGIIYATAAIAAIALGGIFFRSYYRAKSEEKAQAAASHIESLGLPPGSKVIVKSGAAKQAPPRRPPPPPAIESPPAEPSPVPEALPVAEPTAEPPPEAPVETSAIKLPPPRPWTAGFVERALIQQSSTRPTADTCVPILANAREANGGADTELPLQGNGSVILARYDLGRITGWTITKATWNAKLLRGQLRSLGFTALTAGWEEGGGTLKTPATDGATYRWGDFGKMPWRDERSPLTHLIRGNGQSLIAYSSLQKPVIEADQWVSIPVDPMIVQALVAGAANTIAITDEKGQVGVPAVFASRENTDNSHYFEVEGGLIDILPPGAVARLKAHAHPGLRHKESVGVLLTWIAPGDDENRGQAFMYDVRYARSPAQFEDATVLPQYKIPWPQPHGQRDQMIIENLDPDTTYSFFIRARDEAGQVGPINEVSLTTPPPAAYPEGQAPNAYESTPIEVAAGALGLRMTDELIKTDPVRGTPWDQQAGRKGPAETSSLWDRNTRTLRLRAAQNETLGFVFSFTRKKDEFPALEFRIQDFKGPKNVISGKHLKLFQTRYSRAGSSPQDAEWLGDVLVPLRDKLSLDNAPRGQRAQSVYAELHVPAKAEKGTYHGQISLVSGNGSESRLNVVLDVLPIRMPDQPRFAIELPVPFAIAQLYKKDIAKVAEAAPIERAYQQIASDHRCTLAFVPYARNGVWPAQVVPTTAGKGADLSVPTWADWDQRFMSHLAGDPFSKDGQSQAHAGHFILPVFENWPTPFLKGYLCGDDEVAGPEGLRVFAGASDNIYSCMDSDYWRAFRAALGLFAGHFKTLDISNTTAHVWLNNGPVENYEGKTPPWFLGQPLYRDDFLALEAFAQVSQTEASSFPGGRFAFRVNVPDPAALAQYGFDRFSILSTLDLSPAAWQLLRRRVATTGETLWMQTESLPLGNDIAEVETFCLRHFLEGADGWTIRDVVGRPEHLARPQPQSLLYCGLPLKTDGPLPSLRLKALRRAQQDIDYLLLLQDKMNWTRRQLAEFVRKTVPQLEEDIPLTPDDTARLRFTVQTLLAGE